MLAHETVFVDGGSDGAAAGPRPHLDDGAGILHWPRLQRGRLEERQRGVRPIASASTVPAVSECTGCRRSVRIAYRMS